LLALGAVLEGSHTVRVGMEDAQLHLVLSHERGEAGRPDYNPSHHPRHSAHRHGLAAGVLCLLAGSRGMEPDHVATFATGAAGERRSPALSTEGKGVAKETASPPGGAGHFAGMEPARFLPNRSHGPPNNGDQPHLRCSTVLPV
jgi:hypothetical protein